MISEARLPTASLATGESVPAFLARIAQIPLLDPVEEQRLARRWRDADDRAAAHKLVVSNLRFVAFVARGYAGYGLALGDLIQEGAIGLMKAVRRYDPERGVRLISFAVHWIRAEIHEFVLRNWRIVRLGTTKAQRKLFFHLRSQKSHPGQLHTDEIAAIAADLRVQPAEVRAMEARLAGHDVAFDTPRHEGALCPADYLAADPSPSAALEESEEQTLRSRQLQEALSLLDARSRDIVTRRYLQERKSRLRELASEYRVTAERIRQIQDLAIAQLRASIQA
jgi:RNA polymerase sigma-32 factor